MAPYGAKAKQWSIADVEDFVRTTGLPQYQETFRENFIDGRRLLKLKSTHLPQLGITLFAHIKLLNARIQNIAKVSADWEAANGDPERAMAMHASRIQSLARGKISRKRVEVLKQEKEDRQRQEFHKLVTEQEQAAAAIQKRVRGMNQRKRIREQRKRGELPGQHRVSFEPAPAAPAEAAEVRAEARAEAAEAREAAAEAEARAREWREEDAVAAIKIQSRARGIRDRKAAETRKQESKAAVKIQARARGNAARKKQNSGASADEREDDRKEGEDESLQQQHQAAVKIQSRARGNAARKGKKVVVDELEMRQMDTSGFGEQGEQEQESLEQQHQAAVKIQSRARGNAARKGKKKRSEEALEDEQRQTAAAVKIQSRARGMNVRKGSNRKDSTSASPEAENSADAAGDTDGQDESKRAAAAVKIQSRARGMRVRRKPKDPAAS